MEKVTRAELFLWQEVDSRLGKTWFFIWRREKLPLGRVDRECWWNTDKEEMSSGTQAWNLLWTVCCTILSALHMFSDSHGILLLPPFYNRGNWGLERVILLVCIFKHCYVCYLWQGWWHPFFWNGRERDEGGFVGWKAGSSCQVASVFIKWKARFFT